MLHGEPFLQYDEQLMDERAQCTGAVYSFNSTASPSVVIARGDRERNFKRIVAAGWIHPRHMDRRPGVHAGGHLGGNVNVTTPFHCDYGYNISIGDNVNIGPHCQLLDSARIAIGRNTKIGARVTISTLKTPTDTKSLKGSNGTEIAKEVFIGENVYIGDGVIIEAGVRIGNNAIIRAGSVVVRVSLYHIRSCVLRMLIICRILPLMLSLTETQHSADSLHFASHVNISLRAQRTRGTTLWYFYVRVYVFWLWSSSALVFGGYPDLIFFASLVFAYLRCELGGICSLRARTCR
jgi:acetyltransferase-like isoleucine patch superfamily enzyme